MKHTLIFLAIFVVLSCDRDKACHEDMISMLENIHTKAFSPKNEFYPAAKLPYLDSLLQVPHSKPDQVRYCQYLKARVLLETGEEEKAIAIFEALTHDDPEHRIDLLWKGLALGYLRLGERSNCISNHAAESCILPVRGLGVHRDAEGSSKAIGIYENLLTRNPGDLESRWLLNLAYMTLGDYPHKVPATFLIPGMEGDTTVRVNAFRDVAGDLGLDINNMAGGSIIDDLDNDGYLDIMISCWWLQSGMTYFRNKGDGTFEDLSEGTGLKGITGGLNMMQADYNNDGFKDIFVLRGGWKGEFGKEPNSLLRNNGDGTFTDVTKQSGMLSFHPTQTATWNDFNNDGWLDIFIGNESSVRGLDVIHEHACELYINNQDGTFREVAFKANCDVVSFVKGVTSGDYNNDGRQDIFISTMNGERKLLKNKGFRNGEVYFSDVSQEAGLYEHHGNTFPTWFWDYDNDGWLDIFACDYTFKHSLAYYTAAEKLGIEAGNPEKMLLYHNNHDGTFSNVAKEAGLNKVAFAMGSNFGDIDNDGFLDMYLGTGNPEYSSVVPNKMFKSIDGKKFADVTASARVGHLQKGHGVSFADLDNDGDQDVHIEMGGALPGDNYQNSFFLNPGQNNNHWISLSLEGTTSNRSAIGTRIRIQIKENGVSRNIYRDVNTGGSFGASPLRREIGVGQASMIDEIEIHWHGSGKTQVFTNVKADQFLKLVEGSETLEHVNLRKIIWTLPDQLCGPIAYNTKN